GSSLSTSNSERPRRASSAAKAAPMPTAAPVTAATGPYFSVNDEEAMGHPAKGVASMAQWYEHSTGAGSFSAGSGLRMVTHDSAPPAMHRRPVTITAVWKPPVSWTGLR